MNEQWKGIGKVIEEGGEVLQILGKLIAFPDGKHPDKKGSLTDRLEEELADLSASILYFTKINGLNEDKMAKRVVKKLEKYNNWGLTGIATQS